MSVSGELHAAGERLLSLRAENAHEYERDPYSYSAAVPQNRIPMERLTWFIVLLLE